MSEDIIERSLLAVAVGAIAIGTYRVINDAVKKNPGSYHEYCYAVPIVLGFISVQSLFLATDLLRYGLKH
jgi:hypothetical protein